MFCNDSNAPAISTRLIDSINNIILQLQQLDLHPLNLLQKFREFILTRVLHLKCIVVKITIVDALICSHILLKKKCLY